MDVEKWKKQAQELAAQNQELKSQVDAAEARAAEARQGLPSITISSRRHLPYF